MINNRVKIQLTEKNIGYLDVKEGTNFPLNYSVAEIKDLTERKGTFSKTITLANTKNNAKLLNNYYDINVVAGTFNINKLQKCVVLEDNVPIVENAVLQLVGIKKVQKQNSYESEVEYSVLVKEATVDFFSKLGSAKLTDLNMPTYSHLYTPTNIINSWSNSYLNGYKYVMPQGDSNDNLFYINEFHPGIYARTYWDLIFQQAGYSYTWPTINGEDIKFNNLIIPYNGAQEDLTSNYAPGNTSVATGLIQNKIANPSSIGIPNAAAPYALIPAGNEVSDPGNHYNNTTYQYKIPFYMTSGNSLNVNVKFTYRMELINNESVPVYLVKDNPAVVFNTGIDISTRLNMRKNNNSNAIYTSNGTIHTPTTTNGCKIPANSGFGFTPGVHILNNGTSPTVNADMIVPSNYFDLGDDVGTEIAFGAGLFMPSVPCTWRTANNNFAPPADVRYRMIVTSYTVTYTPSVAGLVLNTTIDVNKYVPREINQVDFIKAFVQLYNLFIDIDPNEPNKLIIKTRDEYYDTGKLVDWTKKLYKNKDQNLTWLAASQKKKFLLTYKQDKDVPNTGYESATKEIYGQQDFTYDNEFIKDTDKKEIIFSPTPVTRTIFGAVVPMFNGFNPKTNIRLLYDGGLQNCNEWKIAYQTTSNPVLTTLSLYPLFSHFNKPENPTFDINFGTCDYYYTSTGTVTNNNLYNLHWRRTLNQLNKGHMLTAYFDLKATDIAKMDLNDKIRIDNAFYNINQIIDYNPTQIGPTKVELISIDDELGFVPFKIKPVINAGNVDSIAGPIKEINTGRNLTGLEASGPVLATGVGNTVQPGRGGAVLGKFNTLSDNAFVMGNNNLLIKSSVINGDNNITNEKAFILGSDNNVAEGASNSLIVGDGFTVTEPNTIATENIIATTINGIPVTSITTGLPGVLAIDPTTGGNNIVISSGDLIIDATGVTALSLQNGTGGLATSDGATLNQSIILDSISTQQIRLTTSDGTDTAQLRVGAGILTVLSVAGSGDLGRLNVGYDTAFISSSTTPGESRVQVLDDIASMYGAASGGDRYEIRAQGSGIFFEEINGGGTLILEATTSEIKLHNTIILTDAPVTDNANTKVLARNVTTGNIEEVDITSIPGTTPGLPAVLTVDNTTGANAIVLSNGGSSPITSSSGNSNITMDSGIVDTMLLSQVSGSVTSTILFRPGSPLIGVRMQTINGSDSANMSVIATMAGQSVTDGTNTSQTLLNATTYTINTPTTIIQQVPVTDNTNTEILTRNSATGNLELRDVSSLPSSGTQKYAATVNLAIGNNTITHSLGTADVQIQILDASGNLFLPNTVGSYTSTNLVVNVAAPVIAARVIIIG